jgi:hypothetical protein
MMQTTDQQQWSPRDEKNPFKVWNMLTTDEWKQISRWYEFSVRMPERPWLWHEVRKPADWVKIMMSKEVSSQ